MDTVEPASQYSFYPRSFSFRFSCIVIICFLSVETLNKRRLNEKSLSTTLVLFYVILLDLFFLKCEQKCLKVICVNSVQIIALHLCSQVIQ